MDIDINALLRLARETSGDKRRDLLRAVTGMFMANLPEPSEPVSDLFGEVLTRVVDEADIDSRVALSEQVAAIRQTPPMLARRLANDESIRVAAPVIRRSPVLTESDLLAIAETRADEYLIAMSERDRLDAAITDALIRRGSEAVRRGVTGNSGATFTVQTLRHLLEVAVEDRDVKRNLFARGDLPAHFRELLSDAARFDGDDDKSAPDDETALLVGRIVEDFAAAAGLKPRQVRAMIEGDRLEPTVVIGRALELTEDAFERVLHYRQRRQGRHGGEVAEGMDRFRSLPVPAARRVLHFLRRRAKAGHAA